MKQCEDAVLHTTLTTIKERKIAGFVQSGCGMPFPTLGKMVRKFSPKFVIFSKM